MFERFGDEARQAVHASAAEARRLRQGCIGPEHLLLGLAAQGSGPAAGALAACGIELSALRERVAAQSDDPLDAGALSSLGIDLDAVRRSTEAAFGPGALHRGQDVGAGRSLGLTRFNPDAKKSLGLALREAVRLKHRSISSGHVLLGLLRAGDNNAVHVLAAAGVDIEALRADVVRRLTAAA